MSSTASATVAPTPTPNTTNTSTNMDTSNTNATTKPKPSTTVTSTTAAAPLPPPPQPWEPRSINLYKRENMTLIGEGTYGSVWLAKAPNGTKVALKKIRKEKKEGFPITAIREIKILKQLKHPNIVSLKDVVSSHMPGKEGDIFMVFEFLDHDLTGLLESKVQMSDALIKYYFKSILEGLDYMHGRQILHRDIKGANILVSNNGDVRIADMGLARGMAKGGYTNRVVTLWYRAPELLLGSSDYDSKIDLWSAGCLFAELLTRGTVLFPGNNTELDQLNKIYAACGTPDEQNWPGVSKLKYFQQFTPKPQKRVLKNLFASQRSPKAVDLLDKLLTLNPAERLSAAQALDHEYFFEEPLPLEPHQHPQFPGNHHEFGSKQQRRRPPPGKQQTGPQPPNQQGGVGYNNQSSTTSAAGPRVGPPPFDRMNVVSHEQFGSSNFALNQPPGYHQHRQQPPYQQQPPPSNYPPTSTTSSNPYPSNIPPHPSMQLNNTYPPSQQGGQKQPYRGGGGQPQQHRYNH